MASSSYKFLCKHEDDDQFPLTLQQLHESSSKHQYIFSNEITELNQLYYFQEVIDKIRYILTFYTDKDTSIANTSAYSQLLSQEPELNPFKDKLFSKEIASLDNLKKNSKKQKKGLKEVLGLDGGKVDEERIALDKVFGFSKEEYLKLRKSIFGENFTIYTFTRGWDPEFKSVNKVVKLFVDNIEWRLRFKPMETLWEDIEESAKSKSLYDYGFDQFGNPIIYMIVGRESIGKDKLDDKSLLTRFRHLCVCMESMFCKLYENNQALNYLENKKKLNGETIEEENNTSNNKTEKKHPWNFTWVVDVKDAPVSMDLVKKIKFIFDLLGYYYPERSDKIYVLNLPFFGKLIWAFISNFLSEKQRNQYNFLSDNPYVKELQKNIDLEMLSADLTISGIPEENFKFDLEKRIQEEEELHFK
ncbi:hypothetical protein ABK040_002651 [Willaertia magna]